MSNIVIIDTETNWFDEVMSLGVVIADSDSYKMVDSRYYLIDPECRRGGMYSGVLYMNGTPEEIIVSRKELGEELNSFLGSYAVQAVFAYNAGFDKNHMPELAGFLWYDIMRLAAYRQYNEHIPECALCCKTGRLKSDYGVEPIYRLLSGNRRYFEKHNGWYDAVDELKIMEMLALPIEMYEHARI